MTELQQLPGRIEDPTLHVSQLRSEMRAEFAAVRAGMATASEMRALHQEVISRLALLQEALTRAKCTSRKKKQ